MDTEQPLLLLAHTTSEQGTTRRRLDHGPQSIHYGHKRVRMGTWGAEAQDSRIERARPAGFRKVVAERYIRMPTYALANRVGDTIQMDLDSRRADSGQDRPLRMVKESPGQDQPPVLVDLAHRLGEVHRF